MNKLHWLIREKPIRLFLLIDKLGDIGIQRIIRKIDITYSHSMRILYKAKKENLVNIYKVGRHNCIEYTEKGKELRKELLGILDITK